MGRCYVVIRVSSFSKTRAKVTQFFETAKLCPIIGLGLTIFRLCSICCAKNRLTQAPHHPKLENFNRSIHLQNRAGAQKSVPRRKNPVLAAFSVERCVPALLVLEQL